MMRSPPPALFLYPPILSARQMENIRLVAARNIEEHPVNKDEALQAVGVAAGSCGFTFEEVERLVFTADLDECITELDENGLFLNKVQHSRCVMCVSRA